jgi:hypothetical protein
LDREAIWITCEEIAADTVYGVGAAPAPPLAEEIEKAITLNR